MIASPEWSARTRQQEERLPMRGAACVIEPDDAERERLASLLRSMGFVTHETGCGKLGQMIADQLHLRVVVLDLALRDVRGLLLTRRLRRADSQLVIVALSPNALGAVPAALGRFAGADAVLASPPSNEALCCAINEAEQAPRRAPKHAGA